MLITMFFSYATAHIFNCSLYTRALRAKQVPFLKSSIPSINENVMAKVIMKPKPTTLFSVPTVEECRKALQQNYNCFPILNKSGYLIGQIPASFLIVLIRKRQWYSKSLMEYHRTKMDEFDYSSVHSN